MLGSLCCSFRTVSLVLLSVSFFSNKRVLKSIGHDI